MAISWRRAPAAVVLGIGMVALAATPAWAGATWPTYHSDQSRTGVDGSEPSLEPATTAWSTPVGASPSGAKVYGQPVVADGRVFAASEDNTVEAIDPHSGAVLWHASLGTPLTNVGSVAGCGNIDPLGITSTPVVDTATHTLYVVGEINEGGKVHHQLVGFNTYTGAVVVSDNVDPPLPAGESSVHLLQRAGLALGNGRVYVAYGGNSGDCGLYHGWVVGVNETGPANPVSFEATPDSQGGAVWEAGAAPSIDAAGNVYISTGNSNPLPSASTDPGTFAESVVKLSPTLGAPLASFKDSKANFDADLATNAPVLIANGELFAVGKTDVGYVLRQSNLSLVTAITGICGSDPDGGPAYDAASNTVFVPCRGGGIQPVNLTTGAVGTKFNGPNSGPILVNDHLWAAKDGAGTLYDYDIATGMLSQTVQAGTVPTFATPSAALGLLLIGTTTGVTAFDGPTGLPPSAPDPSAPSPALPETTTPVLFAGLAGLVGAVLLGRRRYRAARS